MAEYKVGERLRSRGSSAQVMVIRTQGDIEIACAGEPMAREGDTVTASESAAAGAALEMGKRYEDGAGLVEVLCVAPGAGPLAVDGVALVLKTPKPLPASD
ncbi:hypothetical protein [Nocardia bovistercoris]|uniref:Uncharacterized protein n=1 Tax=Nocardia bovistercoris TaxID=2785916 RepID=A0A931I5L6_9NOCA|nr:hypothetical protein [Nocardia bovistercoris]MBH0775287.1 hypothetical protein [Nocardia bovistercoris]